MNKPNIDMNILSNSQLNAKSFNENLENVIRKSLTGNSIKSQSTVSSLPEESLNQYVNSRLLPLNEQQVNNALLYSSPTEGVNRNVLSSTLDEKHADMNQKNIENPNSLTHSSSKNNPESLTASLSDQTKQITLVIQENQITGFSELDVQKHSMPKTASKLSNTLFQPVPEMHPKSTKDLTPDMRNQTNVVNSSVIEEKKNSCSFQLQNSHLAFSQPLSESFLKDQPVSLPSTNVKAQGVITITPSEARKIIHDKNSVIQHTKHTSQIKERPQIRSHSPNQPLYHCKLSKHNGNSNLIIPEKPNYSDTVMTFQSNNNCKEGTLTIPNINISSSVIISNQSNRTLPSNTETSFHAQSTNSIASSAMKNIYHRPALQSTLKTKSHEDLSRQRKIDSEKEINSPVMKSQLSFHGFPENKCQGTVTGSGLNYSNNQQLENHLLDSTKYQWLPTTQPCSPINNQSSQFHPSHDARVSESWCANPYSKTIDMPSDKISTYSHSRSYDSISNDTNSTSSQSILKTKLTSSYNSQRNYSHSNASVSLQMKNTNVVKSSYQQFINVSSPSSIVSVNSTVNPPRTEYNSSLPHGSIFQMKEKLLIQWQMYDHIMIKFLRTAIHHKCATQHLKLTHMKTTQAQLKLSN
ncbi:hypothetical protein CEXT_167061 [Caerostris extrusa]|uniref:Uncharacterized protein n=1 Tax=Caerostris extrusa TaxID=172846 RepID=A0AAV4T5P9_CAEEX|nr:hypothetical protein CEXT_167061 [Caerostris extrusa]